jgi:hypothetical protein
MPLAEDRISPYNRFGIPTMRKPKVANLLIF